MTYDIQREAITRTQQELLTVAVRECQNSYALLVAQLLMNSNEFDNANWTKDTCTVTADTVIAPDGTMTADTIHFDAAADAVRMNSGTVCTSKAFTGSVWMRVDAGPKTVSLRIRNVGSTEATTLQVTVTTTWTRFWIEFKFSGTPVDNAIFSIRREAGDDIGDFYAWGANMYRNPGDKDFVVKFPTTDRLTAAVNVSRCTVADQGDGNRCYYSRPTCQDKDNFNAGHIWEDTPQGKGLREFKFCRRDAALPLPGEDIVPLLTQLPVAAQEIDPGRAVTVNERVTFEFDDIPNQPAWNLRQSGEGSLTNTARGVGTFWRRFLAIYPNYGNPEGYAIRKTGFVEAGMTESDFQTRGRYLIHKWMATDRRIKLVCADRLKLARKSIPATIRNDNQLAEAVNNSEVDLDVDDASEVTTPGQGFTVTLELEPDGDAEKVNVAAVDLDTNVITVERGRWGTTARSHPKLSTFREVVEFGTELDDPTALPAGMNPVDAIIDLYLRAGVAEEDIGRTTLEAERDAWLPSSVDTETGEMFGHLVRRTLVDQEEVEALSNELRKLFGIDLWIDDNQMVTGRVFSPARPGESISTIDDDSGIVAGTVEVEANEESRVSRVLIGWDLSDDGSSDEIKDYNEVLVEIDVDAEEREEYGEEKLQVILTEWFQTSNDPALRRQMAKSVAYCGRRTISRLRNGLRIVRWNSELKEDDIALGSVVSVDTQHVQDAAGANLVSNMQIIKKRRELRNIIAFDAIDHGVYDRYGFYSDTGAPVCTSATPEEKIYGYYGDAMGLVGSPLEPGYKYW